MLRIGLDVGSTTVKAVVLDTEDKILWQDYQRHESRQAAKALQLFSHDEMIQSPMVATVVEELCGACGSCIVACPYSAREIHPIWNIATVNAALCQNCGACVVACPNKASQVHNWRPSQILAMVDEVI